METRATNYLTEKKALVSICRWDIQGFKKIVTDSFQFLRNFEQDLWKWESLIISRKKWALVSICRWGIQGFSEKKMTKNFQFLMHFEQDLRKRKPLIISRRKRALISICKWGIQGFSEKRWLKIFNFWGILNRNYGNEGP